MDPKSTKPSEEAIEVSADALDEFVQRIDASGLSAADKKLIKSLVTTVVTLQDERIRNMADGEIFNTITHGKNTMMSYGPNVTVNDRWAIIAYLRALQRSQNATAADVPPEARAELEKP